MRDHQASLVEQLVASGRYQNASEVLREGLRLVEQREVEEGVRLDALRAAVKVGIADIDSGRFKTFDSFESLGVHLQDDGRTLALALEVLGTGPDEPGTRAREDLAPGIRTLHAGRRGRKARHFVVFRVGTDGTVDVLRVLHDSVDLARHIPGANDSSH